MININENVELTDDNFFPLIKKELGSYSKYFGGYPATLGLIQKSFFKNVAHIGSMVPFKRRDKNSDLYALGNNSSMSIKFQRKDTTVYIEVRIRVEDDDSDKMEAQFSKAILKYFPSKNFRIYTSKENTTHPMRVMFLRDYDTQYWYTIYNYEGLVKVTKLVKELLGIAERFYRSERGRKGAKKI